MLPINIFTNKHKASDNAVPTDPAQSNVSAQAKRVAIAGKSKFEAQMNRGQVCNHVDGDEEKY